MTLEAAAGLLRCPVCAEPLALTSQGAACPARHSFDRARQGYLNLLRGPAPENADTTDMVAARVRFLARGWYEPMAAALSDRCLGETFAEAGAGTGHYLARALDDHPAARGLAADVSVAAARRAAKAHARMAAIVADTWAGLPIRTGTVDTLLCVFAPRNAAEFHRVLRPGGRLLVALPEPSHLAELRASLGLLDVEEDKDRKLEAALAGRFARESAWTSVRRVELSPAEVADLIAMGPNAFHGAAGRRPATAVEVTLALRVLVLRRLDPDPSAGPPARSPAAD
ncbi:putative RNA methyltransferase [Propionicicella superfundia]|uniref:putative RNA methyltransferase n=1 Tax=Propionicicella superfundia TaxID=348582 RepID=UPI0004161E98|nr:methyltransferase domain-containing protein [Propionicicella superfundia]